MAYKPNAIMKEETKEKYLKGMKMYLEGSSIEQIAKELHLERRCFSYFLKDNVIEVHKEPTLRIVNYLYKDSKVHLIRKYDLVLPFIENVD